MIEEKATEQIRQAGLEALRRELGVVGTIQFLQLYDTGKGDYTAKRHEWLDKMTLEECYASIETARQEKIGLTPTLPPE